MSEPFVDYRIIVGLPTPDDPLTSSNAEKMQPADGQAAVNHYDPYGDRVVLLLVGAALAVLIVFLWACLPLLRPVT
jgi:hypothetical protein